MSSEWQRTTWGEVATLEYGRALRDYHNTIGDFPVYGTNGPIGFHNSALCKTAGVVIGRKGAYRGVHYSHRPFYVIDTAFYLNPKPSIDMRWAYYALLTCDINSMDSGSAIPSTTRDEFYKLPMLVPPISEQKRIAEVLAMFDDRISLLRETNSTLEAIAQAIFKSWFVDFDPVASKETGNNPEGITEQYSSCFPSTFDTVAGKKIPNGWTVEIIGDVVATYGGGTPDTKNETNWNPGQHYWTSPKDLSSLQSHVLLKPERKISDAGLKKISSGLLPKSTLLLSSRAPIGYLAITQAPVAINQGYIAIAPNGKLSPFYMLLWCKANMESIKSRANGSTFMEISKKAFRLIQIIVPSQNVLDAFNDVARSLFAKITNNEEKVQTLVNIRDTLLPRLISGRLRIQDTEQELERCLI